MSVVQSSCGTGFYIPGCGAVRSVNPMRSVVGHSATALGLRVEGSEEWQMPIAFALSSNNTLRPSGQRGEDEDGEAPKRNRGASTPSRTYVAGDHAAVVFPQSNGNVLILRTETLAPLWVAKFPASLVHHHQEGGESSTLRIVLAHAHCVVAVVDGTLHVAVYSHHADAATAQGGGNNRRFHVQPSNAVGSITDSIVAIAAISSNVVSSTMIAAVTTKELLLLSIQEKEVDVVSRVALPQSLQQATTTPASKKHHHTHTNNIRIQSHRSGLLTIAVAGTSHVFVNQRTAADGLLGRTIQLIDLGHTIVTSSSSNQAEVEALYSGPHGLIGAVVDVNTNGASSTTKKSGASPAPKSSSTSSSPQSSSSSGLVFVTLLPSSSNGNAGKPNKKHEEEASFDALVLPPVVLPNHTTLLGWAGASSSTGATRGGRNQKKLQPFTNAPPASAQDDALCLVTMRRNTGTIEFGTVSLQDGAPTQLLLDETIWSTVHQTAATNASPAQWGSSSSSAAPSSATGNPADEAIDDVVLATEAPDLQPTFVYPFLSQGPEPLKTQDGGKKKASTKRFVSKGQNEEEGLDTTTEGDELRRRGQWLLRIAAPFTIHSRISSQWVEGVDAVRRVFQAASTSSSASLLLQRLHPTHIRSALRKLSGEELVALYGSTVSELRPRLGQQQQGASAVPVAGSANAAAIAIHIVTIHRQFGVELPKEQTAALFAFLHSSRAAGHAACGAAQRLHAMLEYHNQRAGHTATLVDRAWIKAPAGVRYAPTAGVGEGDSSAASAVASEASKLLARALGLKVANSLQTATAATVGRHEDDSVRIYEAAYTS